MHTGCPLYNTKVTNTLVSLFLVRSQGHSAGLEGQSICYVDVLRVIYLLYRWLILAVRDGAQHAIFLPGVLVLLGSKTMVLLYGFGPMRVHLPTIYYVGRLLRSISLLLAHLVVKFACLLNRSFFAVIPALTCMHIFV